MAFNCLMFYVEFTAFNAEKLNRKNFKLQQHKKPTILNGVIYVVNLPTWEQDLYSKVFFCF